MAHRSSFNAERAARYDDRIEQTILGYTNLQHVADICLSVDLPEKANVLIVGAGTGAEILQCAPRHPGWTFTAVEPSEAMVQIAQKKIKAKGVDSQVNWHTGPLATLAGEKPFDAATLLLVLHFLPNNGEKLEMLTDISDRLAPGAPFVLASYAGDPTTTRTRKLYDLAKTSALALGNDPKETEEKFDLNRKDIFLAPEERIKSLLRDSGFIDVQRIYQALPLIAWSCRTQR